MNAGDSTNKAARFAVFDLDGTLCDITHRLSLIKGCEKPDWDGFFAACSADEPKWPVIDLIRSVYGAHVKTNEVVILSGRSEVVRKKTAIWLATHGVPYDHLIMREEGNHEPDHKFKERILKYTLGIDKVRYVVDDRKAVVEMWRRHGLTCFQVAPGEF